MGENDKNVLTGLVQIGYNNESYGFVKFTLTLEDGELYIQLPFGIDATRKERRAKGNTYLAKPTSLDELKMKFGDVYYVFNPSHYTVVLRAKSFSEWYNGVVE